MAKFLNEKLKRHYYKELTLCSFIFDGNKLDDLYGELRPIAPRTTTWHVKLIKTERALRMTRLIGRLLNNAPKLALAIMLMTFFPISSETVWADDYGDGVAAAQKGDFSSAFRLLQPLADQGTANAQNFIAALYQNGRERWLGKTEQVG